ncbi:MAG: hypothetical protein HOV80_19925 [Polyangiaceae bacterium]|nr:hypothetical protein [Polyangiaceae bacterium]
MRHALLPLLLLLLGCGGTVVFEPEGGTGGAGGSVQGTECVGACGDPCTKCADKDCFTGECSEDGFCMPPETPPACPD